MFDEVVFMGDKNKEITFAFKLQDEYTDYFINFLFGKDDSQGISKIERDLITLLKASKTSTDITFQLNKNLNEHHCITTTIKNSEIGKLTIKPKDLQKNKRPNLQKAYEADIVFINTKQERIHIQNIGYDVDSFLTLIHSQDLYDNCSKLSKNNSLFYNLAFSSNYSKLFKIIN